MTGLKGSAAWATARHVLCDFVLGKGLVAWAGRWPERAAVVGPDGGWTCGRGAGGGACIRGGSDYKNARQFSEADAVP